MTLQQWMDKQGIRDADLAARLGGILSRSQISRIRRGVSKPTPDSAKALARVTKIPAHRFVMGEAA